jgi:hypothetical protein
MTFCQVTGILPSAIEVKENNIPLRSGPSHDAELIIRVPINEKLDLLGVDPNGYFRVKNQIFDGYIFYIFVKNGENIFFQVKQNLEGPKKPFDEAAEIRKNDSIADIVNRKSKLDAASALKKRRDFYINKYGPVNGEKVAKGLIWIGMTEAMLLDSRGRPNDINTTVTRYGTSKQYVYGSGQYVYVENGKVDAWQN